MRFRPLTPWALAVLACSHTTPPATTPSKSATAAASTPFGEGDVVPPDVSAMLTEGPCEPKLHAPIEDHVVESDQGAPPGLPGPFLIEPGERLCLLGRPPLDDLHATGETVPVQVQNQALIALDLRETSIGTVLVLRNHFDRPISYRALIKRPGQKPEPTSVCTVRAGMYGLEHWPGAAEALAVGDFRLLERDAKPECH